MPSSLHNTRSFFNSLQEGFDFSVQEPNFGLHLVQVRIRVVTHLFEHVACDLLLLVHPDSPLHLILL